MGMMVTARKVSETAEQIRYEFGFDRQFDRVLTIDKLTWHALPDDGRFDWPRASRYFIAASTRRGRLCVGIPALASQIGRPRWSLQASQELQGRSMSQAIS